MRQKGEQKLKYVEQAPEARTTIKEESRALTKKLLEQSTVSTSTSNHG